MAVVTISRQFGAGGRTLGKMLADKLNYIFADEAIIQEIAEKANVSSDWVQSFEKEAGTMLSRIISSMVSQKWLDRVLADERGYLDEKIYLDYLVLIIAKMGDEGNAVIVGRGSQYILNDHPDAYHVLLVDELENRIKFMMDQYNLSSKKATSVVNNEDKRRANLYKRLSKKSYNNPNLYNIVINMSRFNLDSALKLLLTMIDHR